MGFGARLVLGLSCVFSLLTFAADTDSEVVDDLAEDISRMHEYLPALGNKDLTGLLDQAEKFLLKEDFVAASDIVMKLKHQLIADSFREMSYVPDFRNWKEFGFLPPDSGRDFLHELVMSVAHLRDDFNSSAAGTVQSVSCMTRFIALQNLVTAMRLRQETATYQINGEIKFFSHELLRTFLDWDNRRASLGDSQVGRVTEISGKLSALSAEFAQIKRREGDAAAVLVLNSLKKLGPPADGQSIVEYGQLGKTIDAIEKNSPAVNAEQSPYDGLLKQNGENFDPSQQLQILKLELARRVLNAPVDVQEKLNELTKSEDQVRFWLGVQDIRSRLNDVAPNKQLSPEGRTEDGQLLAKIAPDALQVRTQNFLGSYMLSIDKLEQNFDSSSSSWQKLNPWKEARSTDSLAIVRKALGHLARKLVSVSDADGVAEIGGSLTTIQMITNSAVTAAMERSKTCPKYADLLERIAYGYSGSGPLVKPGHWNELRALLKIERSEGITRAWVNKDTITTAALSALLVGEAVSVIYTGGVSATAMPATVGAIRALTVAGKTITWISRGVIAVSASSNLVDRYRLAGWSGLANMDSAVDAMMVLSVLPRLPIVTPTANLATSRMGKVGQFLLNATGRFQFNSTRLLSQLMMAYSGYQLAFAGSIAEEYQRMGVQVSANEIRARAALGLVTSALVLWQDRAALARARAANPTATAEYEATFRGSTVRLSKKFKNMINPIGAARDFYRVRPGFWRALGAPAVGLGYAGLDYLLINETMLLGHTNPDFNYMYQVEKAHAFPTLKADESAVSMVGISPLDTLLYFGAHADFTHQREKKLYGDRYGVQNFESPEDLIAKLVRYSEVNGPIRYLKIMTHGRPGMLYTQMADGTAGGSTEQAVSLNLKTFLGSGWIDREWLTHNRKVLREAARKAFAPDARIILWACLSGANFDPPMFSDPEQAEVPINIGDQFIAAMGDTFLPEGGKIDASTRILVGLGSVFGSALREGTYSGRKLDEHYRPVVPVVPLDSQPVPAPKDPSSPGEPSHAQQLPTLAVKSLGPNLYSMGILATTAPGSPSLDFGPSPGVWDSIKYQGGRAQYLFLYMPQLWWKYGIMLEGPWWHKWYQHLDVAPTAD